MGARINYVFKQDESGKNVTLYSHWGETEWETDLASALWAARGRWSDSSYGVRIVVSQLIGSQWNSETGFGLYVSDEDTSWWDAMVEVDFVNQMVDGHSFADFCRYHIGAELPAKEETNA